MDSRLLVSREQVRGGERLLRELIAGGMAVTGAAWIKSMYDGQPYLYIVNPDQERTASFAPRERVNAAVDALNATLADPYDHLDPFEIKLFGESYSLSKGILDWLRRNPSDRPTFDPGPALGGVSIDGAYIYPATLFAPQPQSA